MTRNRFQIFPPYTQEIHTHHSYPVCFTSNLFTGTNQTIRRTLNKWGHHAPIRCAILVDSGVVARNRNLIKQIIRHFQKEGPFLDLCHAPFILGGGECVKNSGRLLDEIASLAQACNLSPDSLVFVVGGGAFLDAAGSALAQCRAGIPTANVPTSTLSQCAAGIGAMRFMNTRGIKNFTGITAPPYAAFIDFALLKTLPFEHHISGMAQAFQMAVSHDADFFALLVKKARKLRQNDPATVEAVIHKTALLHLHRARAPFGSGSGPLPEPSGLGCRVAHWLETRSGFKLPHGHALAVGMALCACYAGHTGALGEEDLTRLVHGLLACGLPVWNRFLEAKNETGASELITELARYRGTHTESDAIWVPDGIGALKAVHQIDFQAFQKGIGTLRELAHKGLSADRRVFVAKPSMQSKKNGLMGPAYAPE